MKRVQLKGASDSFHFTALIIFQPFSWKYSISPSLRIPFTSLHFTYHFTYHLTSLITSLHLSNFSPFSRKYSIPSSLRIPFTSLHFTYHLPNPLPKGTRLTGKDLKSLIGCLFHTCLVLFTKNYFPISVTMIGTCREINSRSYAVCFLYGCVVYHILSYYLVHLYQCIYVLYASV
jgi:hypothetical protein